jgi:hypothetical protein
LKIEEVLKNTRFDEMSLDGSRAMVAALKQVKDNNGWKFIQTALHQQYLTMIALMVANPLSSQGGALTQEYYKGQASVYCIVGEMVDHLIEQFQANVQIEEEKLAQDNDEEYYDGE